jgi:secondary thiamine-phosphate synthase enzyme
VSYCETLELESDRQSQFIDLTGQVRRIVTASGIKDGSCLVYIPHTTAGVTINEGADPSVVADIITALNSLVPWQNNYRHLEGNSAAHIKASLMGSSQIIPIRSGKLALGTWQAIFVCEFDGPRRRKVIVTVSS